jgi:ribosomal protein S18 acetylase RimI-like enzyme
MNEASPPAGAVDAQPATTTQGREPATVEVAELTPHMRRHAVRVLADAFLHDPAWVAIGPRSATARWRLLQRYYEIVVGEALRWGGPHWCALRNGTVVGVALTYADGTRFPAPYATLREAPPFLLAGPGPGLRAAYVDHVMKRAHPRHAHLLLWYLAAHPDFQHQGVGRALLQRVIAEAERRELPIYLDTTKPENSAYYMSFGFRQTGDARLPRDARVWFMYRDNK